MPASLRTMLRAPSQPTTWRARREKGPSAPAAVTVTEASVCSMPVTSHPRRMSAPSSRAQPPRTPSVRACGMPRAPYEPPSITR